MIRTKSLYGYIGLTVLISLAAGCDDGSQERDDERLALQQRREQLVIQFISVQNQIREQQGQALDDPTVIELQTRFYDVMRTTMIELDPQAEAWLERAAAVGTKLERLTGPVFLSPGEEPPDPEERTAVGRELAELETIMRPVQAQALQVPAVATAFAEFQDSVAATIVRLDPNATVTLAQMQSLDDEIRKLDEQIAALE